MIDTIYELNDDKIDNVAGGKEKYEFDSVDEVGPFKNDYPALICVGGVWYSVAGISKHHILYREFDFCCGFCGTRSLLVPWNH